MSAGFSDLKTGLPVIGVGLGLRRELASEIFESSGFIDWLEFIPENYMKIGGIAKERLAVARERFPLVSHGINLSIGSADDLNHEYLKSLKEILDLTNSPWFSDHLCFSSIDGRYLHDLLPLPFTREAVSHVAERVKRVQDYIERPFLLENISFYMHLPGAEMTDGQFLAEVVEQADCGILMDVNNVYVNSQNQGFDPLAYLNELPLERIVQLHVAGHKLIGRQIIDTHGAPVIEPVYRLLAYVLEKTSVKGVLLERDQNFPDFRELLAELQRIKEIVRQSQPQLLSANRCWHSTDRNAVWAESSPTKGGRDQRAVSA